jgi:hypothetical protein
MRVNDILLACVGRTACGVREMTSQACDA